MVMTFKERFYFLEELRKKKGHPNGTYVAAKLTKASQKMLDHYVTEAKIPHAADPQQYHSTIIYSRKSIPEVKDYKIKLPLKAKIKEWKLFDNNNSRSGKCLVAIIDSPELEKAHKEIREKYGATHDYPDYHPHVTVSYDYPGPLPKVIPNIELEYGKIDIEPLDPDFTSVKKD